MAGSKEAEKMTHKGGKKAKKLFHRVSLPKATKEKIENLPLSQLQLLLAFIRALIATSAGAGKASRGAKTAKSSKSHRKLSPGVHRVKMPNGMRTVRVLANGRWRFLKG